MIEYMEKKNIIKIITYFIIFSIIGVIIETLHGYFTMGILQSRKGLLLSPLCPVYGFGACFLIIILGKIKNKKALFFYGILIGSISEYILSFVLEAIYGVRFWDYTFAKFNLNSRICFQYSIYWGILSLILIKYIQPIIDNFIDEVYNKKFEIVQFVLIAFICFDALITVFAVDAYVKRAENAYHYGVIEDNKIFNNRIMLKTFPNIRIIDNSGKEIFINSIKMK